MNSDCPQHYALNASGKEAINLGSISASGHIAALDTPLLLAAIAGKADLQKARLKPLALPRQQPSRCASQSASVGQVIDQIGAAAFSRSTPAAYASVEADRLSRNPFSYLSIFVLHSKASELLSSEFSSEFEVLVDEERGSVIELTQCHGAFACGGWS